MKPEDDVEPLGPHLEYVTYDNEEIDDLIDSLWHYGSAQDYPIPDEIPKPSFQWVELPHIPPNLERRLQTKDRNMDNPPVPGYRDFPECVHIDFGGNHAQQITQTGKAHGRRRA